MGRLCSLILGLSLAIGLLLPVLAQEPEDTTPDSASQMTGETPDAAIQLTEQTPDAAIQLTGKTPDTAVRLTGASPQLGRIIGDQRGAFNYFWIDYPGDGTDAKIALKFSPTDDRLVFKVGLRVYQGKNLLVTALGNEAPSGTMNVTVFSRIKAPMLVQVSNYLQGREVSFQLTLAGLDFPAPWEPPAEAPPREPSPAGATPESAVVLTDFATASIGSQSGGGSYYLTVDYRTGKTGKLRLEFSPSDPITVIGLGLKVWQGSRLIAKVSGTEATSRGVASVLFGTDKSGPLLIQLYNYGSTTVDMRVGLTWG